MKGSSLGFALIAFLTVMWLGVSYIMLGIMNIPILNLFVNFGQNGIYAQETMKYQYIPLYLIIISIIGVFGARAKYIFGILVFGEIGIILYYLLIL